MLTFEGLNAHFPRKIPSNIFPMVNQCFKLTRNFVFNFIICFFVILRRVNFNRYIITINIHTNIHTHVFMYRSRVMKPLSIKVYSLNFTLYELEKPLSYILVNLYNLIYLKPVKFINLMRY